MTPGPPDEAREKSGKWTAGKNEAGKGGNYETDREQIDTASIGTGSARLAPTERANPSLIDENVNAIIDGAVEEVARYAKDPEALKLMDKHTKGRMLAVIDAAEGYKSSPQTTHWASRPLRKKR